MERTVAGDDEELVVVTELVHLHVWKGGHNLVLGGKLGMLLELKVTNRS